MAVLFSSAVPPARTSAGTIWSTDRRTAAMGCLKNGHSRARNANGLRGRTNEMRRTPCQ